MYSQYNQSPMYPDYYEDSEYSGYHVFGIIIAYICFF